MTYLLDTNVISAIRLPARNPAVARWVERSGGDYWLSVFSVGELEKGILQARDPASARELRAWVDGVLRRFESRVLAFGPGEARKWGAILAPLPRGVAIPVVDSQIAATALEHGLSVVTRNVKDFERFGVPVINPWDHENGA